MSQDKLHRWVTFKLGKASLQKCFINAEHKGRMEWANISRKYYRNEEDWIALCKSCHSVFDRKKLMIEELKDREKKRQTLLSSL